MAPTIHFSSSSNMRTAMIEFGQLAREHGLNVGVQETMDAMQVIAIGGFQQKSEFYYAIKSIYCCSEEDALIFDRLYNWYWGVEKLPVKGKTTFKNQSNLKKKTLASLVMLGQGKTDAGEEETRNVSGANAIERLRKTDFTKLSAGDSVLLEQLAQQLWQQMSWRLKRKMKTVNRKGKIDLRKTIRHSISSGGEPIHLKRKNRQKRPQRLVMMLDVSGSMDKYSFFLLRFICALRSHFRQIEAFIFSTRLIRITEYLHARDLDTTLAMLSQKADNWSSGTQIGACLEKFNEIYSKKVMNGQPTVVLLSDGLDTGEPAILTQALKKIKMRSRQLIWLNPLKGMQGYEPVQRGMQAALPEVDVFRSAHNLDSILELEKLLLNV